MELALLLYAASIADNLRNGAGLFIIPLFLATLVSAVCLLCSGISMLEAGSSTTSDKFKYWLRMTRISRRAVAIFFFAWTALMVLGHLVPTRKEVYVMAGGYVALKAARDPIVQDTATSVVGSIERWLDKELANAKIFETDKPQNKTKKEGS